MNRNVTLPLTAFLVLFLVRSVGVGAEITRADALVPQGVVDVDEIVRKKMFPGGVDEGQLEVQAEVPDPSSQANLHNLRAEVLQEVSEDQGGDDSGDPSEMEDAEADLAD